MKLHPHSPLNVHYQPTTIKVVTSLYQNVLIKYKTEKKKKKKKKKKEQKQINCNEVAKTSNTYSLCTWDPNNMDNNKQFLNTKTFLSLLSFRCSSLLRRLHFYSLLLSLSLSRLLRFRCWRLLCRRFCCFLCCRLCRRLTFGLLNIKKS